MQLHVMWLIVQAFQAHLTITNNQPTITSDLDTLHLVGEAESGLIRLHVNTELFAGDNMISFRPSLPSVCNQQKILWLSSSGER